MLVVVGGVGAITGPGGPNTYWADCFPPNLLNCHQSRTICMSPICPLDYYDSNLEAVITINVIIIQYSCNGIGFEPSFVT